MGLRMWSTFACLLYSSIVWGQQPQVAPTLDAARGAVQAATQAQGGAPAPATPAPSRPAPPAAPTQPPAPAPTSVPAPGGSAKATSAAPPPPDAFTYQPEGRRDPFVSLIGIGETRVASKKGEGAAGVSVDEISVRGILDSGGRMVAMIEGPDKMTYIVHLGDRLLDGTIKSITPQGLIVSQQVNDPLSIVKQRDVSKLLRSLEVPKQ